MANTVIAIRASGTAAATPSLGVIANGEIALNYADGIIYYKTSSNTLGSIRTTQPAGLTTEVQYNDAGSFGSNANFTYNKTTGVFSAPIVASSNNGSGTNFRVGDDAWIGDINVADTLRISGQQNVNNAYIVFGATNANTLGRAGSGPLTYTGAFTATGTLSGNELTSTLSSGPEGGQVNLAIPASGTSLVGSVTIDVYQNQLRFFQGDSAKGAYIDLTAAAAGVGTNLMAGAATVTSVAGATGAVSNNQILSGLLTVDGSGSGLDADLLDGLNSTSFANAAFANTDYTTISATAGTYGNAAYIPVTTLTANGRVSSITNTAISIATTQITSGVLPFAQGGTNAASYTTGTLLTSNGTAIISLANTGTAGTYGNAAYHPVITTDAYGRVSAVTNTAIAISAAAVTSGTLAVAQGGTGVTTSTGTGSVTLNTAPTISLPTIDNIKMGYTTVATAAGTTTLTASSNYRQFFTGTTTQTIVLPVTSTLVTGIAWEIENNSTGLLTVNSSGGNLVGTIPAGVCAHFVCIGTTLTTAADWDIDYISTTTITGTGSTVLSASPTLTGTPLAPTASSGTNNTQIATTAFATSTASDLAVALAIALG